MRPIREIEHRDAALIPGLGHDVATRDGNERAVVSHAILLVGLRDRELVVARRSQCVAGAIEDRIRTPRELVGCPASRRHSAAPFVAEQHLGSIVVEGRRVPVRKIRIDHSSDSFRMHRVANIEQDAVPRASAGRESDSRVDGDVVAHVRLRGGLRARPVRSAEPQSRDRTCRVRENSRRVDYSSVLGRGDRHLDDVDPEQRCSRI